MNQNKPFLQKEINQLQWTLEDEPEKPPDFEPVLLTVEGYDKTVVGMWMKNEWFLLNNMSQKFKGLGGKLKVLAWRYFPEIYKA